MSAPAHLVTDMHGRIPRSSFLQTRMAHSSYGYMFGKPALRFLLEDYMQACFFFLCFIFSPPRFRTPVVAMHCA